MPKHKKGFTLIELLIVIAIIGILSAIGLIALNGAREKSRDSKRQSDLDQIRAALLLYHDDNSDTFYDTGGTTAIEIDGGMDAGFTAALQPYLPNVPAIPKDTGNTDNNYWYINDTGAVNYAIGSKMEGGNQEWFVDNNQSFGGKVDNSSAKAGGHDYTSGDLTCAGGASTSTNLDLCNNPPSGV